MPSSEAQPLLLDVNALLALAWPNHQFHAAAEAVSLLAELTRDQKHVYLETLPAPAYAESVFRHILGHQQVTDAYLLAVAGANGATLLSLDRRIVPPRGWDASIEIIEP